MPIDRQRCQQLLRECDLRRLFVEELGWDRHTQTIEVSLNGQMYTLSAIAQKRGMVAFECPAPGPDMPDHATRRKIEAQIAKSVHEHLIVYVDAERERQVWQWVKREAGRPRQCREHRYHISQDGESLLQKLDAIAFTLDEEADLTLVGVTGRVRAAFDVDRVTKRFYDRFKAEHDAFLKFLKGIPDEDMQRWYVSVMLNRLMFIYFIQKRGFLNGDRDYLRNKLADSKRRGKSRFYREFLCPLFFEGFAKMPEERSPHARRLLGEVPYLNGGIFMRHQIESRYGEKIQIADAAFEKLFDFFDAYQWHLDERPLRRDNEINPDVLGYIFEKYINQKQMGAYYTKEDITGYISQNTVIPHLLDTARRKCRIAFEGEQSVWRLLQEDPDRYIYPAVRSGVIGEDGEVIPESALPDFVQAGMRDPKKRMFDRRYNLGEAHIPGPDGENLALPTETWREYVARRNRCLELRAKLAAGEIRDINDLITYNLDIRQFIQDVIENCEGPELLRAFWLALQEISVLDPASGSGAFLFAALNILEPLYEACLERMEAFLGDLERSGGKRHPRKFSDFRQILERVEQHPNRRYFVLKTIILNNLFGVDIMEEAVEICKLRLFLKLVAQVDSAEKIEPLPDIDFNIRAGNSLVGFASYQDVQTAIRSKLDFDDVMGRIQEKAEDLESLFFRFRQQQTEIGGEVTAEDKAELRRRLEELDGELNRYLAVEYGVAPGNKRAYEAWLTSHKPFHWFVEFYGIMSRGGFDVVIGNPPYVEYAKVKHDYTVRGYKTELCGNLFCLMLERSEGLRRAQGCVGMIIPISFTSSAGIQAARDVTADSQRALWLAHFSNRPGQLFAGAQNRLTILLSRPRDKNGTLFTTQYYRWNARNGERRALFSIIRYQPSQRDSRHSLRRVAKIGTPEASQVLKKIDASRTLGTWLTRAGPHRIFWVRVPGYFCQFFTRAPKARPLNGGAERVRGEVKQLTLQDERTAAALHAILNSSTYYVFFCASSDGRHINASDVYSFPLDIASFDSASLRRLGQLSRRLDECMRRHMTQWRKSGLLIDTVDSTACKPIIDQIDQVLAKHYGFTDEELDFIINYDIKYRMGRETGGRSSDDG